MPTAFGAAGKALSTSRLERSERLSGPGGPAARILAPRRERGLESGLAGLMSQIDESLRREVELAGVGSATSDFNELFQQERERRIRTQGMDQIQRLETIKRLMGKPGPQIDPGAPFRTISGQLVQPETGEIVTESSLTRRRG